MTCHSQRIELLDLVDQAVTAGARRDKACDVIGISSSTLRRWRPAASATVLRDNRPDAIRPKPYNSYTEAERENILHMCNSAEFASLPPSQIVPILADREEYIGSESTLYRVLKDANQLNHRGRAKAKQKRSEPSTYIASAPNQVWMMILPGYQAVWVVGFSICIWLKIYSVVMACIGKCLSLSAANTPIRLLSKPCGAKGVCSTRQRFTTIMVAC